MGWTFEAESEILLRRAYEIEIAFRARWSEDGFFKRL